MRFPEISSRIIGKSRHVPRTHWNGINFNGRRQVHPRVVGRVLLANPTGPGRADPVDGRFDDPRPLGRDEAP